jgi:hypothetical protein
MTHFYDEEPEEPEVFPQPPAYEFTPVSSTPTRPQHASQPQQAGQPFQPSSSVNDTDQRSMGDKLMVSRLTELHSVCFYILTELN